MPSIEPSILRRTVARPPGISGTALGAIQPRVCQSYTLVPVVTATTTIHDASSEAGIFHVDVIVTKVVEVLEPNRIRFVVQWQISMQHYSKSTSIWK